MTRHPHHRGRSRRCTLAARRGGSLNINRSPTMPVTTTHPGSRRGGSLNAMPMCKPARRMACTPAARRVGSLNHLHRQCAGMTDRCGSPPGWGVSTPSAYAASTAARSGCTRQPAGVGVSTVSVRVTTPTSRTCTPAARRGGSLNPSHLVCVSSCSTPAAQPGWESQLHRAGGTLMTGVHPGSPPGWESQHPNDLLHVGGVRRAPRQPAGVGAPTRGGVGRIVVCTPAARRGGSLNVAAQRPSRYRFVHPGSPPGWESQPEWARRHQIRPKCTPAARRGGVSTSRRQGRIDPAVHPGSPPGWESQLRQRQPFGVR